MCQASVQNEAEVERDVRRREVGRVIKIFSNEGWSGRQWHSCWFSDMLDEVGNWGGGGVLSGGVRRNGSH